MMLVGADVGNGCCKGAAEKQEQVQERKRKRRRKRKEGAGEGQQRLRSTLSTVPELKKDDDDE